MEETCRGMAVTALALYSKPVTHSESLRHWGPKARLEAMVRAHGRTGARPIRCTRCGEVPVSSLEILSLLEPLLPAAPPSLAHATAGYRSGAGLAP